MSNITILNFSSRNTGNCGNISRHIVRKYANYNANVFMIDQQIGPCGNCDYECLKPGEKCPNVTIYLKQALDSVLQSDICYLILPNFCGGPCANYYAFNERSVGYFGMDRSIMQQYMAVKKRFIIVSNTEGPAFDLAIQQQTSGDADVLFLKTGKYGKRSIAGDLLESAQALADLDQFLEAYLPEH